MDEFDQICHLADKTGFKDFTQLQWQIFSDERFFDCDNWLFVTGATGSGKTLIALFAYFFEHTRRAKKNLPYKMLFTVPYRALAAQKTIEIKNFSKALGLNLKIFQSTSEYLANDVDIFNGQADIAVIINEKIFMFACNDPTFLDRYDLLVFDEIGLVKNMQRGIKTDFVLLHAQMKKNLRIIALGTPFYDWDNYIKKFGFVFFKDVERPIKLLEMPVLYDEEKICGVAEGCKSVSVKSFSESEFFKDNKINLLKLIAEICSYHLRRNERILIFLNSRYTVRSFARKLSRELVAKKILTPNMSRNECKKYVRDKIQAYDSEILCGVMDDRDYDAFSCGICYHNADMFSALRTIIEEDFISEDGFIKIVFSTETLAFGINSCADVVIVPEMEKHAYKRKRFLYPNEYMNYCGRAGRLDSTRSFADQKKFGYVYPFIRADEYQQAAWRKLQAQIRTPEKIVSNFLTGAETDTMNSFYVLSLFSLFDNSSAGISCAQLEEKLKTLPGSAGVSITEEILRDSFTWLAERKLIFQKLNEDDDETDCFKASDVGKNVAGYVVTQKDYDYMLNMICEYVTRNNFFYVDMFYSVVSSKEVLTTARNNICKLRETDEKFIRRAILRMKLLFLKFRGDTTSLRHNMLMTKVDTFEKLMIKNNFEEIRKDNDFFICRTLAAVLMWFDSENCSPVKLYDNFKIYYEPMHRIIEIISYRLELIAHSLPYASSNKIGSLLIQTIPEEHLEAVSKKIITITEKILFFPSQELCDFLGFKHCDLYKAQRLRKVEKLYTLLKSPEKRAANESLFTELVTDMKNWHSDWLDKFKKYFGGENFWANK